MYQLNNMPYSQKWDKYDSLSQQEKDELVEPLKNDVAQFDHNISDSVIIVTGHGVYPESDDPFERLCGQAETYKNGDPTLLGPLTDIALGLKTYHVLELKDIVSEELWLEEMSRNERKFRKTKNMIIETLREIRES